MSPKTATVIIPTTGAKTVDKAIKSVYGSARPYIVFDGLPNSEEELDCYTWYKNHSDRYDVAQLPINVGANGFYGHRIYAAFTHLVNTDYVLYLDQDCWFEPNHVESCINTIEQHGLDWCYSLRRICDESGSYICNDNFESLGRYKPLLEYNHIDTNCYCIKTSVATKIASAWHGGWGQDRVFYQTLAHHFPKYDCTGEYTVNYRLGSNPGSVKREFFEQGNKIISERIFPGSKMPWVKY